MEDILAQVKEILAIYGIRVIAALAIFIIGRWVAKGLRNLLRRMMTRGNVDKTLIGDERVLKDQAPLVAVSELADSTVNFTVRVWTKSGDYWGFLWDTTETVKKRFDAEDISIPYPQQDVHHYHHKS